MEIKLSTGNMVAIIDDSDFDLIKPYNWHARKVECLTNVVWYAMAGSIGDWKHRVRMHRLILGATSGQIIDHVNGDGLDNRRSNLRFCTHAQNRQNQTVCRKYEYKGIAFTRNRWQAYCGKQYLGKFKTPLEAALAYDVAAKAQFGEFANLNFP